MSAEPEQPQAVPDSILTPALELAWAVAKIGSESRPPLPIPSALRPLLRFKKLNGRALATLRRAVDEDGEFRGAVALAVTEETDAAAALFLKRPDGWQDELAALSAERDAAAARGDADRAERDATRKLAGAEAARRRSEAALAEARAALERASSELANERQARRQAEDRVARSERRVGSLVAERDRAHRRAEDLAAQVSALRGTVEQLRADVTERDAVPDAVRAGVASLTQAMEAARDALGEIVGALDAGGGSVSTTKSPSRRRARTPERRPIALPPGVFDDSLEAAEHLVRAPGVHLIVDGYNATLSVWAGVPLVEQRTRLLDALHELAARTGASVHVVFDGDEQSGTVIPPEGRRSVSWRFSPPGVEADDVILELIEATPPNVPIVVASSDRRVQAGAVGRGANPISSAQLFGVLRRQPG